MANGTERRGFGKLLREFRVAAGLSQEALAERARLSVDGIGALERGVNRAPQRETLTLLLEALPLERREREAIEEAAARPTGPRTAARARKNTNLPRLPTPLFGREHDLERLLQLIGPSRLLTLTGAGGVGKTRLAAAAGAAALPQYADGVWFVDLAPVRDAQGVSAAIAAVFGVREHSDRALLDATAGVLARKNLLLILDNCEHLVSAAAIAVESIAASCTDVRILATSRQPLQIAGEQTYRVASLDLEASVSLFIDAARRADASFVLEESELPTAQRIVRRLDGISLAIELAAARVNVLSLEQLEERLAERFVVLSGGGRPTRHQTMRALVDWSYDLLSPEERLLFARLGVFPGEFSFEAAIAVCAGGAILESRVLDILGSLVDKSLLTSEARGRSRRFRLLETIRAYALERLGEAIRELNRPHAQYYLAMVESGDSRAPQWHDMLEGDYDNLRRALDWTIDENGDVALGVRLLAGMREFLLYRGLGADAARRAERALDGRSSLEKPLAAMAWETIASMRGDLLMPTAALEACIRALELYGELEDFGGVGRVLRGRGVAYLRLGDFAQAQEDLQRALELGKECGDRRSVARTLVSIAVSYEMMGRPQEGRKPMLDALEIAQRDGDERIIGVALLNLAETEFALGEVESSARRLEELLASRASRRSARLRANAKANLSVYLLALHRDDEARANARAAVLDAQEAGDPGIVACAIQHLAAMMARSDPQTAAKLLGYVDGVFAAGYRRENTERHTHALLLASLRETLEEDAIAALEREGATMSEVQAAHVARRGPRPSVNASARRRG